MIPPYRTLLFPHREEWIMLHSRPLFSLELHPTLCPYLEHQPPPMPLQGSPQWRNTGGDA
jgi:hypothetical protein